MNNRTYLIQDFLIRNNIQNFRLEKIAGDASFRSYFRAFLNDGKTFIIMDAPPEFEDIKPFYVVDEFLVKNNFSAPKIFAADYENGFLLLEDLGDDTYGRVLSRNTEKDLTEFENNLYKSAVDLLLELHKINPLQDKNLKGLKFYDDELLMREVMMFVEWYLPYIAKKPFNEKQIKEFQNLWLKLFSKKSSDKILVLRDYHADNLMLLKNRSTTSCVGLLDFQDAVIGSPAYDLVSLLEDARRDVGGKLQEKMLQYYLDNSKSDSHTFLYDYQLLSLQRNIKIIGIFARLAVRDKKENYLSLLPRVFGHVNRRLQDNIFQEIKPFLPINLS